MLLQEDKLKLEAYVDNLIDNLKKETNRAKQNGLSGEKLLDKVTSMTVNKLTPESKMVLSSVYNMMMNHTLEDKYFSDSSNKAKLYSADILKELNNKFDFTVPSEINYEKSHNEFEKLIASGVVVLGGGAGIGTIIHFSIKKLNYAFPGVGIAVIIVGLMCYLLKNIWSSSSSNTDEIINEYFATVKKSLFAWVESIETYYDEAVAKIKERG